MMRNWLFGSVFICAMISVTSCSQTPSPDWSGNWKVNPSKGTFQGPIITISISADGEYRWDNEISNVSFRCDGQEQSLGNNRTRVCVQASAAVLDLTLKQGGMRISANHWELSAGGSVLTTTRTEFHPNGQVTNASMVCTRISGSGFAGQWRDTRYLQTHADVVLKLDDQALHVTYLESAQHFDAPLSGADAPVQGSNDASGLTYAVTAVGSHEFRTLQKIAGKTYIEGSLVLGGDGKAYTESWWNPGRPSSKATLVYEKR